ncbi:MAG: hypothetical protein M3O70_28725 [Actinomycetota bacterium]|nr:hypothetical protein [Actinomycetota bacterium]
MRDRLFSDPPVHGLLAVARGTGVVARQAQNSYFVATKGWRQKEDPTTGDGWRLPAIAPAVDQRTVHFLSLS